MDKEVDLIPRGMTADDAQALIKEQMLQAGVDVEHVSPQGWNVGHRIANAAHKAGFTLGMERMKKTQGSLLVGQLGDFMYDGFGASDDNLDIQAAFKSLGLPDEMVKDIMQRVVHESGRAPIDMVLHCPSCGLQHVDASEPNDAELDRGLTNGWGNPPHRTHLCHGCGHKWRPADVPTNGVAAVKTKGKDDSPIVPVGVRLGEVPGHGLPDWPADLKTFQERSAYQRGVADARRVTRQIVDDLLREKNGKGGA